MNASRHYSSNITRVLSPIILGICCKPNQCEITEEIVPGHLHIKVTPEGSDYALLCGKAGRTIKAFKYVTKLAGLLEGKGAAFDIISLAKGEVERPGRFIQNPMYDIHDAISKARSLWGLVSVEPITITHEMICDKLMVFIHPDEPFGTERMILGIGDVLYPYGYRKGMLINVKKGNENNRVGTGQVLGNRE